MNDAEHTRLAVIADAIHACLCCQIYNEKVRDLFNPETDKVSEQPLCRTT